MRLGATRSSDRCLTEFGVYRSGSRTAWRSTRPPSRTHHRLSNKPLQQPNATRPLAGRTVPLLAAVARSKVTVAFAADGRSFNADSLLLMLRWLGRKRIKVLFALILPICVRLMSGHAVRAYSCVLHETVGNYFQRGPNPACSCLRSGSPPPRGPRTCSWSSRVGLFLIPTNSCSSQTGATPRPGHGPEVRVMWPSETQVVRPRGWAQSIKAKQAEGVSINPVFK